MPYDPQGNLPPYAVDSETSEAAARKIEEASPYLRADVYRFLRKQGGRGATCNEVERTLLMRHQTASARLYELRHKGLIVDSGQRRTTDSNRWAVVWAVKS